MTKHVDFDCQVSAPLGGRIVRPDMLINLAGGRHIIVDAKVPFTSYLDALETDDPEEHAGFLRRHAHLMRGHDQALSQKDYIEAFQPTPEFVILFVPADPFLDAALSVDPELIEYAFERNVVIATPSSLFALLRTVAMGWHQEDIS
ncbi:DNA recombination protein RmuC, partial [Rahnella aceris]|uniref:DNA recombination protein RmuC n=1 Tax=Rahnella sp. (strain Y9602) TaxID=2703885 RepID=UPI0020B79DD6